jgi:hypothetical protein
MKLDKDAFSTNMNMVKLDGKKVLVRPSQDESTKGKEVVKRRRTATKDDQAKKSKRWPMAEE